MRQLQLGKLVMLTEEEYGKIVKENRILKDENKKLQNENKKLHNENSNFRISEQLRGMCQSEIDA